MATAVTLTEYTDPFSGWAWGSEPKLRLLEWRYARLVRWRRVMAGSVGEGDSATVYPEGASKAWADISRHTRMPFVRGQDWSTTSSDIACRAVKAGQLQGEICGKRVLRRLREAYFLEGYRLDSADAVLVALSGLPGLSWRVFIEDFRGDISASLLREDRAEVFDPTVFVRTLVEIGEGDGRVRSCGGSERYAIPTIVFRGLGKEVTVAGWKPFEAYEDALREVYPQTPAPRPDPDPAAALRYFGSLTAAELEMLCGPEASLSDARSARWQEERVFFAKDLSERGCPVGAFA